MTVAKCDCDAKAREAIRRAAGATTYTPEVAAARVAVDAAVGCLNHPVDEHNWFSLEVAEWTETVPPPNLNVHVYPRGLAECVTDPPLVARGTLVYRTDVLDRDGRLTYNGIIFCSSHTTAKVWTPEYGIQGRFRGAHEGGCPLGEALAWFERFGAIRAWRAPGTP